jgi:hypothetical protein
LDEGSAAMSPVSDDIVFSSLVNDIKELREYAKMADEKHNHAEKILEDNRREISSVKCQLEDLKSDLRTMKLCMRIHLIFLLAVIIFTVDPERWNSILSAMVQAVNLWRSLL